MGEEKGRALQQSYDRLAAEYARRLFGELAGKPLDREVLDRFAARVRGEGEACDVGCGPGQVARYLHERGVEVCGLDLSDGMVEQARRLNPGIAFRQGTMLRLDFADETLAGITAFYSLIHIPRKEVVRALAEFKRVLKPRGLLLLAFHIGEEDLHLDVLWDEAVSMDFYFFMPAEMEEYLQAAGFVIEEIFEREPYAPDVEHQSRRAYVLACKPACDGLQSVPIGESTD